MNQLRGEKNVFRVIVFFSCFIALTNWSLTKDYERESGVAKTVLQMQGLGYLVALIAVVYLAIKVWRTLRVVLHEGRRIPQYLRIWGQWRMLVLLWPLGVSFAHQSISETGDNVSVVTRFEYGCDNVSNLFVLSAAVIMLYQVWVKLELCLSDQQLET